MVIAGDAGFRRGKPVPLKGIVDEALDGVDLVEKVVVFTRNRRRSAMRRTRHFRELMKLPPECPARGHGLERSAVHSLYLWNHGQAERRSHVHGGFMVGTTTTWELFFDISDAISSGALRISAGS